MADASRAPGGEEAGPPPHPSGKYDHADLQCDLVMKGGITSGVIYPLTVCELAETYQLRCIGGASAGAIAAAFAAAAEYGRDTGGFVKLEEFPVVMGRKRHGKTQLVRLFQPDAATSRLFDVMWARVRQGGTWGGALWALILAYPGGPRLGLALGVVVLAAAIAVGVLAISSGGAAAIVAGVFAMVFGVLAAVALLLWAGGRKLLTDVQNDVLLALPSNGFGICSGMPQDPATDDPPLTQWLHEQINRIADLPSAVPLTFGHLRTHLGRADGEGITLRMMTTDLTAGLPRQMPWANKLYYFNVDEFRRYFPADVVDWLVDPRKEAIPGLEAAASNGDAADGEKRKKPHVSEHLPEGYARLPEPDLLPVVVATRMSLSFPILLSAVPLYTVDFGDEHNQVVSETLAQTPGMPDTAHGGKLQYRLTTCWFSDGGICSNFPVHLFDAPLPRRPTFAINLREAPGTDKHGKPIPEEERVYLPRDNDQGRMSPWTILSEDPDDSGRLGQFAGAIFNAMQNWVDNSQLTLPGVSDRVAHIYHTSHEGGMNLDMGPEVMRALGERGRIAGRVLVDQFVGDRSGKGPGWGWRNHRWRRYRVAASGLEEWLDDFRVRFRGEKPFVPPSYEALFGDQPSARLEGYTERARKQTESLNEQTAAWDPDVFNAENCPKSPPRLRLVPTQRDADDHDGETHRAAKKPATGASDVV